MSGAASYWQEREEAKAAALKMAAGLSARERGLAVAAAVRGLINDAVHDRTCQRRFERVFLSLDVPDANGDPLDYGDCGWTARRMLRDIDAPFWDRVHEMRFAAALNAIPEAWRPMLEMIRARRPRVEIMRLCGISRATYFRRIGAMRQIVEA